MKRVRYNITITVKSIKIRICIMEKKKYGQKKKYFTHNIEVFYEDN